MVARSGRLGPNPQVTPQVTLQVIEILRAAIAPRTRAELQRAAGLTLLEVGLPEMTIAGKPRSSRQRYRTTDAGRRILSE